MGKRITMVLKGDGHSKSLLPFVDGEFLEGVVEAVLTTNAEGMVVVLTLHSALVEFKNDA